MLQDTASDINVGNNNIIAVAEEEEAHRWSKPKLRKKKKQ
jgi:hypothetical protein